MDAFHWIGATIPGVVAWAILGLYGFWCVCWVIGRLSDRGRPHRR